MDIYYYCSYIGSPVGFIMGKLTYDPDRKENYILSREGIPETIRECFETGGVRNVFGCLPRTNEYLLLMKKLTARGDEEFSEYYMNIAIVTDDKDKFQELLGKNDNSQESSKQDIAESIKATIEVDRNSDFGLTVKADALTALLKKSFYPLFSDSGKSVDDVIKSSELVLETPNPQLGLRLLKEAKCFQDPEDPEDPEWDFYPLTNGKWSLYKKKRQGLLPVILGVGAAAVLLLLIWMNGR